MSKSAEKNRTEHQNGVTMDEAMKEIAIMKPNSRIEGQMKNWYLGLSFLNFEKGVIVSNRLQYNKPQNSEAWRYEYLLMLEIT